MHGAMCSGENERELCAQFKERAACTGEIACLYHLLERAPPCSSTIERGEEKRGDRGREAAPGTLPIPSSHSRRFCSSDSQLMLLLHGLQTSAPSVHCVLALWPMTLCGYALSRTACFRLYMGSASSSSAHFHASRPGPAPVM